MPAHPDSLVLPLHAAQNDFLEVLVTRFTLTPAGGGVRLAVSFDENSPTIWRTEAKVHLLRTIPDFQRKAHEYQQRLDAILLHGGETPWEFDDPDFPFRYVSGGTLPIVRMGTSEYYALIYREVFPVGWNIANGGSDSALELMNPLDAVERELREELIVFDPGLTKLFVFESDSGRPDARPEYRAARRLWQDRSRLFGVRQLDELGEELLPVKWLDGPDSLQVHVSPHAPATVAPCFLNINADDFGIEVDRAAKLSPGDDAVFADGEFVGTDMVGSVVGLFEVRRTDKAVLAGEQEFRPDVFYYDLRRHDAQQELDRVMETHIARMERVRGSHWDRGEWDRAEPKYALCPATRRMLYRCARQFSQPRALPQEPYEIFISYASEDQALADAVYDHLRAHAGRSVFYSRQSVHSRYGEEIDNALTSARALVAVATNPRHLAKPWPQFECRAFNLSLLNGVKPASSEMVSYISGFSPRELPMPLLCYQAIEHDAAEPTRSLDELLRFLTGPPESAS